jgi:hypothetical protein
MHTLGAELQNVFCEAIPAILLCGGHRCRERVHGLEIRVLASFSGGSRMSFVTLLAIALAIVAAGSWWLLRTRRMAIGNWAGVVALALWAVGITAAQWWPKAGPAPKSELVQSLESIAWPVAQTSPLVASNTQGATASSGEGGGKAAPVESLIGGLETRLQANPNDAGGWSLLAQSYAYMADEAAVENAVRRAVALGADEQALRDRVGRAMRSAHGGDWDEQTLRAARKP